MNKPHLSASSLTTLSQCGIKWAYKYLEGMPDPASSALVIGGGVHRAAEKDLQHKINTSNLLPEEEILDFVRDTVVENWNGQEIKLDEKEREQGPEKARDSAVDRAVAYSGSHHDNLAPILDPEKVEWEFKLELKGYDYNLVGAVDVLEKSGFVRDLKTAKRAPNENAAKNSLQLSIYSMAKTGAGSGIVDCALDYVVNRKKGPTIKTLETFRDQSDYGPVLRRVSIATKTISSGAFNPAPEGAWWCGPKYCNFWEICPFGQKNRRRKNG